MSEARHELLERMKAVAEGEPEFRKAERARSLVRARGGAGHDASAARAHGGGDLAGHLPTVSFFLWFVLPWIQPLFFLRAPRCSLH